MNAVISKRFAKRQQMQWTQGGAHLLLQTRTRTLDGTLRPSFERWTLALPTTTLPTPIKPPPHDTPGSLMLSNIVEQNHWRVKRLTRPGLGFGGFWTARRTLAGFEVMR